MPRVGLSFLNKLYHGGQIITGIVVNGNHFMTNFSRAGPKMMPMSPGCSAIFLVAQ